MDDKRRKSLNKKRNNMIGRFSDLSEMERDYLESICKELNDDWKECLPKTKEEWEKYKKAVLDSL
jgi:arsenate reductase-like glutaredoxin family protein